MSGPIVRKYGFPNFDKIFGPKPLLHGVDKDEAEDKANAEAADAPKKAEPAGEEKAEGPSQTG